MGSFLAVGRGLSIVSIEGSLIGDWRVGRILVRAVAGR